MTKRPEKSEQAFLVGYDPGAFDHPSVAVDVAVLTIVDGQLAAILVRREEHPDKGKWALPGGFVRIDESLDAAAERVLREKAGQSGIFLEQLYTFGAPARDPRTRVIAVAYYALVPQEALRPLPEDENVGFGRLHIAWPGETGGPAEAHDQHGARLALAFDHGDMLGLAVLRLRGKLNYAPVAYQLLPETFTLRALQDVHEAILGRAVNKDSFRRRLLATGDLKATGEREESVGHRPAELYRFEAGRKRPAPS